MTEASRQELADAATRVLNQLDRLTTEVEQLRKRGRRWVGVLALFVAAVIIAGTLAAADARRQDREQYQRWLHQDRENSRRWCSLLNTITAPLPPGQARTPATDRQRKTLAELNKLRDQFDCR